MPTRITSTISWSTTTTPRTTQDHQNHQCNHRRLVVFLVVFQVFLGLFLVVLGAVLVALRMVLVVLQGPGFFSRVSDSGWNYFARWLGRVEGEQRV